MHKSHTTLIWPNLLFIILIESQIIIYINYFIAILLCIIDLVLDLFHPKRYCWRSFYILTKKPTTCLMVENHSFNITFINRRGIYIYHMLHNRYKIMECWLNLHILNFLKKILEIRIEGTNIRISLKRSVKKITLYYK